MSALLKRFTSRLKTCMKPRSGVDSDMNAQEMLNAMEFS